MSSRNEKPQVSEAERAVLEVLWDQPPHPSAELVRRLSPRGWSETTIKTLVARLVKKGFAAFDQVGNRYLYRPLVGRDECLVEDQARFIQRWSGTAGFALLARFVETTPLSPEEISELKKILEDKTHESP